MSPSRTHTAYNRLGYYKLANIASETAGISALIIYHMTIVKCYGFQYYRTVST